MADYENPTDERALRDEACRVVIADLVPAGVVVEERFGDGRITTARPEELALIAGAVEKRRQEFLVGRACARRALIRLGRPEALIPVGARREPLWPSGVVGSITHCDGYCAAAVAEQPGFRFLGIDAEPDNRLPDGVLRLVTTTAERAMIARLDPGLNADTLLFSIKESMFKAWYPLTKRWLDFQDATVTIDPDRQTFRARQSVLGWWNGRKIGEFAGRYRIAQGVICTAIAG